MTFRKRVYKASVTRCNLSCNLCRNGVRRHVAGKQQCVTCPFCYLFGTSFRLLSIEQTRARLCFLQQWTITLKEAASLLWDFYRDPLRLLTLLSLNVLSQKS